MKRYVIFALAAPVVVWAGLVVVGGKQMDKAGLMMVVPATSVGLPNGWPVPSKLTVGAVAAGLLAAYLTR